MTKTGAILETYDFSFSVVIIAENHNPTILNPDFLKRNNIIEQDWPVDQNRLVLTTPAHSEVSFLNGVTISLDPRRLIIKDMAPTGQYFPVPEIATKFLQTLPHVSYNKIGINFEKAVIFDNKKYAYSFQKDKYLKNGPWSENRKLNQFVCKFIFLLDNGNCNVSFSSPQQISLIEMKNTPQLGILASANFDRPLV
jgi:hypothetical protein